MIDYMKPVGAFLEHTIRPLISELQWFIKELESRGIYVTPKTIDKVSRNLFMAYFKCLLVQAVKAIVITWMVCKTTIAILAS